MAQTCSRSPHVLPRLTWGWRMAKLKPSVYSRARSAVNTHSRRSFISCAHEQTVKGCMATERPEG